MENNQEDLKAKIMKKLPEVLPQVVKSIVVHIVMMIYHISMPPWVIAIKAKKTLRSNSIDDNRENHRRRSRRSRRR